MADKKHIDPRDMASKCELLGGTGGITAMCPVGSFLEIYKMDKTFRVYSPDSLDPERKDPKMPFMANPCEDYGSGSPIVSRVLLQTYEMIRNAPLKKSINVDEVVVLAHSCKEYLLNCEKAFGEFGAKYKSCAEAIQSNSMVCKFNTVSDFPIIVNLNEICSRFLSNAKMYVDFLVKIFNEFFGTTFNGPNFKYPIEWIEKNLSAEKDFIGLLVPQNVILKRLIDLRNAQEHPNKQLRLNICNFRLLAHKNVAIPEWHLSGQYSTFIYEDMTFYLSFLLQFFELCICHFICLNLESTFPFIVRKIPKEQIQKDCPILYRLEIDPSVLSKK